MKSPEFQYYTNERESQNGGEQLSQRIEHYFLKNDERDIKAKDTDMIRQTIGDTTEMILLNMQKPGNQEKIAILQDHVDAEKGRADNAIGSRPVNTPWLLISRDLDLREKKGYKGIRENELTVIGRSRDHKATERFDCLQQNMRISRTQFDILLQDGYINIRDLNSTNGTRLEVVKDVEPDGEG